VGVALTLALAFVGACGGSDTETLSLDTGTGGGASGSTASSTGTGGGSTSSGGGDPFCGDSVCQMGETPATCIHDCPPVCGDGACNGGETAASCAEDCGACGDGLCNLDETIATCPDDCPPTCGDGQCNGTETFQSCPMDCPPTCGDGQCNGDETGLTCAQDCGCAHAVCETGEALSPDCDPCVQMVCGQDAFCCNDNWDGNCVGAADSICGAGCCGDGQCNGESCDSCPMDCGGPCVCGDGKCEAEDCASCAQDCGACFPDPVCPHSVCFTGIALDPAMCFDACADEVCAAEPSCCMGSPPPWSGDCSVLGQSTCGADPCVTAVCNVDPTCCSADWTQDCVDLAKTECMTPCDCDHDLCATGPKLSEACDPCVSAVCTADPFCCDGQWDGYCVGWVEKICGITCN
jgi:hypothetical protein